MNDPVAEKLLKRATTMPRPVPPEDKSITTLYIGNVNEQIDEKDIRDYFYQFGEIRSINIVRKSNCAFVQFTTRTAAEAAIEKAFQKLTIHGYRLAIRWGKSQGKRKDDDDDSDKLGSSTKLQKVASIPGLPIGTPDYFGLMEASTTSSSIPSIPPLNLPNISSQPSQVYYPSQDPSRMGSLSFKQHKKE